MPKPEQIIYLPPDWVTNEIRESFGLPVEPVVPASELAAELALLKNA